MRLTKRTLWTCAGIYLICQIFLLINIQFPVKPNFDEFHYIPSAKQFLELRTNQNWEHPPLGKLLIAVGIELFGDRPIGWRFMSTVFGSITLVAVYLLGLLLFESPIAALWITGITLVNQIHYVQSRIGMLDPFMFCFIIWGIFMFCRTWNPRYPLHKMKNHLIAAGALFGYGTAAKWFTVVPWFACLGIVIVIRLLQKWRTTFGKTDEEDWYHPQLWAGIHFKDWILYLGVVPMLCYFSTFIPYLFIPGYSFTEWLSMQWKMWDGQLRVVTSHPYMSQWLQWPLMNRPIWFAFDREGPKDSIVRGVIMLGNPLIMWSGLLALVVCVKDWVLTRNRTPFIILYFYLAFYLCWSVIPRKISFYYYYYPAGMMLSFALADVFFRTRLFRKEKWAWAQWAFLGVAAAVFIYFFPILAGLKIPSEGFRKWMWLPTWI